MNVHESEIKNIVNSEIQEFRMGLQKTGCFSEAGCLKGKQHDNYIHGKLQSTLNDFKIFSDKQIEINKSILEKFETAAKFSIEAATAAHASAKLVENFRDDTKLTIKEVVDDLKKSNRTILFSFIGALVLMLAASVWGTYSKLHQDDVNQVETSRNLKVLIELLGKGEK